MGRLEDIEVGLSGQMEVEELILYPHVIKRLKKHGIHMNSGHQPDRVPKELI
jgi:hypothetical protein